MRNKQAAPETKGVTVKLSARCGCPTPPRHATEGLLAAGENLASARCGCPTPPRHATEGLREV